MNRSFLPLGLFVLLAPALSTAADQNPSANAPARVAEPREVIVAFADLCIMAPNAAAEDAAVKARGGKPITETPPPGAPPGRHFDLQVDGMRSRVGFAETVCMLDIDGVDIPATATMFDGFLADVFQEMGIAEAQDSRPLPTGGRKVRDLHIAQPGDQFGMRLTLFAFDHDGAPSTMVLIRNVEDAYPPAQAAAPPKADATN